MATVSLQGSNFGTTSSSGINSGLSTNASPGDVLVIAVAADNNGTNGASSTSSTLTDSASSGNVYTRQNETLHDPGAAAAGETLTIWTCPVTVTLSSTALQASFSPNTVAKCIQVYRVRPAAGEVVSFAQTALTGNTGSATSHAAPATPSMSTGDVVLGFAAIQTNTAVTGDSDTTNGSWAAIQTTLANVGGSDASSMTLSSQSKVVTGAGAQNWACTTAVAKNSARNYVWLVVTLATGQPLRKRQGGVPFVGVSRAPDNGYVWRNGLMVPQPPPLIGHNGGPAMESWNG